MHTLARALWAKGSLFVGLGFVALASPAGLEGQVCTNTVTANVVALDQVFFYNRLGVFAPGMVFALERDIVPIQGNAKTPGNVRLRDDKRPRPLTLRVNVGDCLEVTFTNLLDPDRMPAADAGDPAPVPWDNQPATRAASFRVVGMQLVGDMGSDGSNVGSNGSSLVEPGDPAVTYTFYAEREGTYFAYSGGAQTGGEGDGGSLAFGLFGAVNVEPEGSEWYRSQLTNEELGLAQAFDCGADGCGDDPGTGEDESANDMPAVTDGGQPILDYDAVYPSTHPRAGGETDVPIISMTRGNEIVHSDLNGVITGPGRGWLNVAAGSCEQLYPENPIMRDRCEPFREFTVIFHDEIKAVQAFSELYLDPVLGHTLHSVRDGFAINYGTGGIGSEIVANRVGVGPMAPCNECKYEEFFLTSWAVGDPAMVVDNPAWPTGGDAATKAIYPDDPSNVFHSYLNDRVKIRNLHAGPKEHHIFHLHAHQWVTTPDSHKSSYLDSQAIGPGAGFTYEITYGGSGNRPKTPGDAIFHCHFYPHFAQGMWALWRVHDTFERGSLLDGDGTLASGAAWDVRALPDGEIDEGVATPAVVPLPGKAMAPMPTETFPGYPFYIPGQAGHRPPQPPMDFAPNDDASSDLNNNGLIDGGLPRHVVLGGESVYPLLNRLDFSKENITLNAMELPHEGTPTEQNAMVFHEAAGHSTFIQPTDGSLEPSAGWFETNGLAPVAGAPFADPCRDDAGNAVGAPLLYKGSAFQIDAAYTKTGWHFPQHRQLGLNADVGAVMSGEKPAEPFFFRANTNHCIDFWLTNLLPKDYQMDDFQVLTPTDVMGQHIHLVKFDVTSSDGSANGYNYEDGSLSPEEVVERIHAINKPVAEGGYGGLLSEDGLMRVELTPEPHPYFKDVEPVKNATIGGRPLGDTEQGLGLALGAQSTVQRWYADDVLDNDGEDRTLRTVFTHDHFAPSTQQQAGYYAGLVVEPEGSVWRDNETGEIFGPPEAGNVVAADAGYATDDHEQAVTSWQAIIDMTGTDRPDDSYREYMFEYQDFQLAYTAESNNLFKPISDNPMNSLANPVETEGIHSVGDAINPPAKAEIGLPLLTQVAAACPGGVPRPCPEGISADDPGIMTVNYRAEPIALRTVDRSVVIAPDNQLGQAAGLVELPGADGLYGTEPHLTPPEATAAMADNFSVAQGDLSFAFLSGQFVRSENPDCKGQGANAACPPIRTPDEQFLRAEAAMNLAPDQWPYLSLGDEPGRNFARGPLQGGALPGDPITPLLRGYAGDKVQVRQLVGAHEEGHNFSLHGVRWMFEPSWSNSGYRSSQMAGISEHFEFRLKSLSPVEDGYPWEDHLYTTGAAVDDLWSGVWGLIRSYSGSITGTGDDNTYGSLATLPNNPEGDSPPFANALEFRGVCHVDAPVRAYSLFAVRAADIDPDGLVYNSRSSMGNRLTDPNAIVYVYEDDVVFGKGKDKDRIVGLRPGLELEPLILRANAGDCIEVKIERNLLPEQLEDHDGFSTLPLVVGNFNSNEITPSSHVGLSAQLVEYNVHQAEGWNVGWNGIQTLAPGAEPPKGNDAGKFEPKAGEYQWYAGEVQMCTDLDGDGVADGPIDECIGKDHGWRIAHAMEYGAVALSSSDAIQHAQKGAMGALVIEPQGSTWLADGFEVGDDGLPGTKDDVCMPGDGVSCSRASATVTLADGVTTFRDFVLLFQDDVNLVRGNDDAVANLAESEDPEDSGQKAFNYKTEPMWQRFGFEPDEPLAQTREIANLDEALENDLVGGDPETPIFTAEVGTPVRFRVVHSGGHARNHVFALHGHVWQQLPFTCGSSEIGENRKVAGADDCADPTARWITEFKGSQEGIGPTSHFNFVLQNGAGGAGEVAGDYLYRDQASFQFDGGLWGIMRVCPEGTEGNSGNKLCLQQ